MRIGQAAAVRVEGRVTSAVVGTGRILSRYGAFAAPVVMALLSVPALRLAHPPADHGRPPAAVPSSPAGALLGHHPGLPAGRVGARADMLLARLTPPAARRQVSTTAMLAGPAGGAAEEGGGGGNRHLWSVACTVLPPAGAEEGPEGRIELRFDADTGGLVSADSTVRAAAAAGQPIGADGKALTAGQAVRAAGSWLGRLGLATAEAGPDPQAVAVAAARAPAVLFPPRHLPGARLWRVWLRGREAPGGQALTVMVAVGDVAGELKYAAVVERAAVPSFHLPRPNQQRARHPSARLVLTGG